MAIQNVAAIDIMTLEFISPLTNGITGSLSTSIAATGDAINDYTEIAFEKDFFTPSDTLKFTIATNNPASLTSFLKNGYRVLVKINENYQMVGYIFSIRMHSTRHGGTELSIEIKDLLEYMAQGSVPPNMYDGPLRSHFLPTDTFNQALTSLANNFASTTGLQFISIQTNSSGDLQLKGGGPQGQRVKMPSTLATNRSKSINNAILHLEQPNRGGESYLAYMLRLVKHIGGNLKMSGQSPNIIFAEPPVYDRIGPDTPIFRLIHYVSPDKSSQNNVHSVEYYFNADNQPSVVIVESNTTGGGNLYQTIAKGVAVNELSGYTPPLQPNVENIGGVTITTPPTIASISNASWLPTVLLAISHCTAGAATIAGGTGWDVSPFNLQLYLTRASLAFITDQYTQTALPHFNIDPNAHTSGIGGETCYSAAKYLAECQDKYIEIVYHVDGWTYKNSDGNQYIWQPNVMVSIIEEAFSSPPALLTMWIRRVLFTKNRHGGTETEIHCTLPYTHNFEITSDTGTSPPQPSDYTPIPITPPPGSNQPGTGPNPGQGPQL